MNEDNSIKCDTHMKFINIMHKFRNNTHLDKAIGMKKSEYIMLLKVESTIVQFGTATVSQISEAMNMTNAAASKTIGDLEDNGYIKKKVNKEDKRQVHIELTQKGKDKFLYIKDEIAEFTQSVFDKFGKENADKLLELMEKMYEVTSEEIKNRLVKAKKEEKEEKEAEEEKEAKEEKEEKE